jgi:hypothetical protein
MEYFPQLWLQNNMVKHQMFTDTTYLTTTPIIIQITLIPIIIIILPTKWEWER